MKRLSFKCLACKQIFSNPTKRFQKKELKAFEILIFEFIKLTAARENIKSTSGCNILVNIDVKTLLTASAVNGSGQEAPEQRKNTT